MSEDTLLREVDEELRGDRLRALWRRFAPWIIGAAVLVVLAVAVNEGWRWWQNSNAARSSDQFYSALEAAQKGDMAAADAALQTVIAEGSGGYPILARFRQAALLVHQGKAAEAVAAYDALATDAGNRHLRELALLMAGNVLVDSGDVAAVQQRVGGLVTPQNPMRNTAREEIGLAQYKAGDLNAALATFSDIAADPLANPQMQQRVQIYIAQLVALGALTPEQQAEAAAQPAAPAVPATPVAPEADAGAPMAPAEAPAMAPVAPEATPMTAPAPEATPMMAPAAPESTPMMAPADAAPVDAAPSAAESSAPPAPAAEAPAVTPPVVTTTAEPPGAATPPGN